MWPEKLDPDAIREIRAMKERAEEITERKGLGDRELKRGRGGIRDIEFAVQLLQLVHGRDDGSVRSPTTLDALHELADGGYVDRPDVDRLDRAYQFLRTVEHRIQLYDEQQTHLIPSDEQAAGAAGPRPRLPRQPRAHRAANGSRPSTASTSGRSASIHERLFFAPAPRDARRDRAPLARGGRGAARRLRLHRRRAHPRRGAGAGRRPHPPVPGHAGAPPGRSSSGCRRPPTPTSGSSSSGGWSEGPARSASLAVTFRDAPGAAERTCHLLGASRVVGEALRRQPEFVDALDDDDALARETTRAELVDDAFDTLEWRGDDEQRREGLRRFKRRELLRIATRDLLGYARLEATERELTVLAEACLEAALASLRPPLPFAVIGMGRLGGGELSYASDIDVMFVYDGESAAEFDDAEHVATRLVQEIGATTAEGQTFRIDARLRPQGNQGPLARSRRRVPRRTTSGTG